MLAVSFRNVARNQPEKTRKGQYASQCFFARTGASLLPRGLVSAAIARRGRARRHRVPLTIPRFRRRPPGREQPPPPQTLRSALPTAQTGAMDLAADTVAERLRDGATQSAALDALEAHAPPIPTATALAAAPALVDVLSAATEHAALDRAALLFGRLVAEAAPEPAAVFGAATQGERYAALFAPDLLVEATQRAASTGGQALTQEDARSFACIKAFMGPMCVRGQTQPYAAGGRTTMEALGIVSTVLLPRVALATGHCDRHVCTAPSVRPRRLLTRDGSACWRRCSG